MHKVIRFNDGIYDYNPIISDSVAVMYELTLMRNNTIYAYDVFETRREYPVLIGAKTVTYPMPGELIFEKYANRFYVGIGAEDAMITNWKNKALLMFKELMLPF